MARPILPWRSPLHFLPPPGVSIWIRRLPWYDRPVLATAMPPDSVTVTPPNPSPPPDTIDLSVPMWMVHSWKFQLLADELAAFPRPDVQ